MGKKVKGIQNDRTTKNIAESDSTTGQSHDKKRKLRAVDSDEPRKIKKSKPVLIEISSDSSEEDEMDALQYDMDVIDRILKDTMSKQEKRRKRKSSKSKQTNGAREELTSESDVLITHKVKRKHRNKLKENEKKKAGKSEAGKNRTEQGSKKVEAEVKIVKKKKQKAKEGKKLE